MALPIHIEAMTPQNRAGCSLTTFGPGVMPWIIMAPIISAIRGCAGMPRVSIGMKEVCAPALFAVSGAATPSIAPLPKRSGCLRDLLLERVGREGRENRAAAGQRAEERAEERAADDRARPRRAGPSRLGIRLVIFAVPPAGIRHRFEVAQNLGDAEDAERHGDRCRSRP